jgi:hypothetical protein
LNNIPEKAVSIIKYLMLAVLIQCFVYSLASAQISEKCTVSVLNRIVTVKPDGSWQLDNVPSNMGQVRVRVTCTENGVTVSGQSEKTIREAGLSLLH